MHSVNSHGIEESSEFEIANYVDYVLQSALEGSSNLNSLTNLISKFSEDSLIAWYFVLDPGCEVEGVVETLTMGVAGSELVK